jgi:hypothetical protein
MSSKILQSRGNLSFVEFDVNVCASGLLHFTKGSRMICLMEQRLLFDFSLFLSKASKIVAGKIYKFKKALKMG